MKHRRISGCPTPSPAPPVPPALPAPQHHVPLFGSNSLLSVSQCMHPPPQPQRGAVPRCSELVPVPTCVCVCVCVCVAQLCLTLCDPTDCNPPGSFVPGAFQARIHAGSENPSWASWEEAALVQAEVSARRWRWGLEAWCERWMGAGSVQTLSVECNSNSRQF